MYENLTSVVQCMNTYCLLYQGTVTPLPSMSQTNPRSRVALENLMFLYVYFNIILPFMLSLPAWFFPCSFLTQTLCTVLVPTIRAT